MKPLSIILIVIIFSTSNLIAQKSLRLNDSAMGIYKADPQKAIIILEKALSIAQAQKNNEAVSRSNNNLAIVYRDLGQYERALKLSQSALITKDSLLKASAQNNIGVCHRNLANYDDALSNYLKALKIYEAKNLEKKIAAVFNSIGLVYSYNGINEKALEYHEKAKRINEKINNKKGLSEVHNNMAIIFANNGQLNKALESFKYSLHIEEDLDDKKGIAESVNNVGAVFYYLGQLDSARIYFEKSVKIERLIGNNAGIAASYNNIADLLMESQQANSAKIYIDSAMHYARASKVAVDIETALFNYSRFYEAKNDNKRALDYYKSLTTFRDSILNIKTNTKIAELEIEYDTEKKKKKILAQRVDIAEKELEINNKNIQISVIGISAFFLIGIGYLFYNQQKLKNRQLQKENELKDALIKIESQNRLQEQRLRISRDLHDNIGAQLTFIISSIDNLKYGFNIKNQKLKSKLHRISAFTSSTISELRDTIWAMNKDEISLEDLQMRISNYLNNAHLYDENITFLFSVGTDVNKNKSFTSLEGMNIYRIIQEAIHNSLKYSGAKRIEVNISEDEDEFNISITDDGRGFNINSVEQGNGLKNMEKRSQSINTQLIINSDNKGTQITIKQLKNT